MRCEVVQGGFVSACYSHNGQLSLLHLKFVERHGVTPAAEGIKVFNWVVALVEQRSAKPHFIHKGSVPVFLCQQRVHQPLVNL